MSAALGTGNSMDLVDNHRPHAAEHPASFQRREHDVERLRRRDQDVWRLAQHARPSSSRSVASAHSDTNFGEVLSLRLESLPQLCQWPVEIPLDVIVQSFQRRDVEEMNGVGQRLLRSARDQLVQLPEERSKSFPRPGRSEDQRVLTARNRWPSLTLRVARILKGLLEPFPHQRMKARERRRAASHINVR